MYLAHFYHRVNKPRKPITGVPKTYREHTNTFESSDVFVEILCISSDFMPCCNRCFEQILRRVFCKVGTVRDVNGAVVSV